MRILHLTIKKKWFDMIAKGEKKQEFREAKTYWWQRLINEDGSKKEFDEIHMRNGYSKDNPFMRIKWNGWIPGYYEGDLCYAIDVSEIIEITNWEVFE